MILIHMMHHTWNFRFHPLEHGLHAYGPRGDQFNIWLQGSLFCNVHVLDRQKNHQVDLDPHWVESPYTHSMKTKIGEIESLMLASASHSMHRKYHMEITHVEHTRRSKTQNRQKRPKMAIFGGFKALAKSGVEVLQNKNFSCKVQSI